MFGTPYRPYPLDNRRVGVVQFDVKGMRRQVRKVIYRQTLERIDHGIRPAKGFGGETVRGKLVPA